MIKINQNYNELQKIYFFSEIYKRVDDFQKTNPEKEIIKMGVGDVTKPLPSACIAALHRAADDMSSDERFQGYGPYEGFLFLREKIVEHDFKSKGIDLSADEIFVSDGAKCDSGNIQEIFSQDIKVAIPDPVYPVFLDTNVMAGRAGEFKDGRYQGIYYLDSTPANGFVPDLPELPVDLIYLCFPNNPTGATIDRGRLKAWVEYAIRNKALILFDAAYEAFVRDSDIPRSIYEIEGAETVAVEFRSFSKTAGFTGTRCSYTVVPKACTGYDDRGQTHSLHDLWYRRQSTKYNGVSYPIQKAAEAVYSPEGQTQIQALIDYYMENAVLIRNQMTELGFDCVGGENSPYIWVDCRMDSWDFFDLLLNRAAVVCTPGSGFGKCGQGFARISAFNSYEKVEEAMGRIKAVI